LSSALAVVTLGHLKLSLRSCLWQKGGRLEDCCAGLWRLAPARPCLGVRHVARLPGRGSVMQLGVMLEGQEGLTWDLWRRSMPRVEELGFESLWCSDHFMSLLDSSRDTLETWVALTVIAADTTRLRFGSLVSPMTFRHPSLLAQMAVAVDTLSGGRLVLGVGAGWNAEEHRAFGIPFPPFKDRLRMLEEGIE